MSNSASTQTIFTSKLNDNTAFARSARSSVGAGYRCGVWPSQTQKSPKKRFFSEACGRAPGTESRSRPAPYIGAHYLAATSGGRRGAAQQLRPVNKGFPGLRPRMKTRRRIRRPRPGPANRRDAPSQGVDSIANYLDPPERRSAFAALRVKQRRAGKTARLVPYRDYLRGARRPCGAGRRT
jgi:hypothetical protein